MFLRCPLPFFFCSQFCERLLLIVGVWPSSGVWFLLDFAFFFSERKTVLMFCRILDDASKSQRQNGLLVMRNPELQDDVGTQGSVISSTDTADTSNAGTCFYSCNLKRLFQIKIYR